VDVAPHFLIERVDIRRFVFPPLWLHNRIMPVDKPVDKPGENFHS
jgi:hypothetical protein